MADIFVLCDAVLNFVFKESRVRKIKAFINPQRHDRRISDDVVAKNIAVMFGAGDLANFCNMRLGGLVEVQ